MKTKYRGPIIPFDPDLPPAAFPTLDTTKQSRPQQDHYIDTDVINEGNSAYFMSHVLIPSSKCDQDVPEIDVKEEVQTPESVINSNASPEWRDLAGAHLIRVRHQQAQFPSPVSLSNASEVRTMSTESEGDTESDRQQGAAPEWKNLSRAHKVQLSDLVGEAFPNDVPVRLLRLSESDIQDLNWLLNMRNNQLIKEEMDRRRLQEEWRKKMMRPFAKVTEAETREMYNRTIWSNLEEDVFNICTPSEVEQARAYLRYCNLDPSLLDGAWLNVEASVAATWSRGKRLKGKADQLTLETSPDIKNSPAHDSDEASKYATPSSDSDPSFDSQILNGQKDLTVGYQSPFSKPRTTQAPLDMEPREPHLLPVTSGQQASNQAKKRGVLTNCLGTRHSSNVETVTTTSPRARRRATLESEVSFLNRERRPGARQPKLTEKAVTAESRTTPKQSTAEQTTTSSGASTKKRKASPGLLGNVTTPIRKSGGKKKSGTSSSRKKSVRFARRDSSPTSPTTRK